MLKHRKGSIGDSLFWVAVMLFFGILIVIGWKVQSLLNDAIQDAPGMADEAKTIMTENTDRYVRTFDNLFLITFVGIFLSGAIAAYFIYTHPALYWLTWPLIVFYVAVIAIIANVGDSFFHSSGITEYFDDFTIMPFIFDNYVKIITLFILLFLAFMFVKGRD